MITPTTSPPSNPKSKAELLREFMNMSPAEQAEDLRQRHQSIEASADESSTQYLDKLAAREIGTNAKRWMESAEVKAGIV